MLDAQIRNTQQIISSEPTSISLRRPAKMVADGAGGFMPSTNNDKSVSTADRFFGTVSEAFMRVDQEGREMLITNMLVCLPDDDIQFNDYFTLDGRKYLVSFVEARPYQKKAFLSYIGAG